MDQETLSTSLTAVQLSLSAGESIRSTGFAAAKRGTQFGFHVARTFFAPVASVIRAVVDHSLGWNDASGAGVVTASLHGLLNVSEAISLFGISIGDRVSQATLAATQSGVSQLSEVYGNNEALRALSAFVRLLDREYTTSLPTDPYPTGGLSRWSGFELATAAATYAALQSVTRNDTRYAKELEELDLDEWGTSAALDDDADANDTLVWQVTDEEISTAGEEVIAASVTGSNGTCRAQQPLTDDQITRQALLRFSKMCLGSYGGMGMLFFGVKLPTTTPSMSSTPLTNESLANLGRQLDEESLSLAFTCPAGAVTALPALDAAAMEREDEEEERESIDKEIAGMVELDSEEIAAQVPVKTKYGLWSILKGTHDVHVLEQLSGIATGSTQAGRPAHDDSDDDSDDEDDHDHHSPSTTLEDHRLRRQARSAARKLKARGERRPPRYFVVTDHSTRSILLVLRGTISLDDIATDLACDPAVFDSALFWDDVEMDGGSEGKSAAKYQVHGGMFETALSMSSQDSLVARAVAKALRKNADYDFFLIGHSLGAGIAALLGIIWTNPTTGLTSSKSGLPVGRKVKVYGFAPPCTTDAALSYRCRTMICSFVYSSDAVSRFSLGHIRDLGSAIGWLLFANREHPEESCRKILQRVVQYRRGALDSDLTKKEEEQKWFTALRTTLEANMTYADLFPPGLVYWLVPSEIEGKKPIFYKFAGKVDIAFSQMLFTKDMLSSHLPHRYMQSIDSCL